MKTASLTLLLAWAAPAHADTTLPSAAPGRVVSWADSCSARIDGAAKSVGLKPGAKHGVVPLVHENGSPNPVQHVEYFSLTGPLGVDVTAGTDGDEWPNKPWIAEREVSRGRTTKYFRRFNHRWAEVVTEQPDLAKTFKLALDECLLMGDPT